MTKEEIEAVKKRTDAKLEAWQKEFDAMTPEQQAQAVADADRFEKKVASSIE